MDFEIPEKVRIMTGMIDEFMEKEIIPLESDFLRGPFREMLLLL